jgi:hypothetical protein
VQRYFHHDVADSRLYDLEPVTKPYL